MDFFDVVEKRRSIRRFTTEKVPENVILKSLEAAIKAPNSSNAQTWDFYWIQSDVAKTKMIEACLSQSAAKTASDLVVIVASPKAWKRSQSGLIQWVQEANAHPSVIKYYQKIVPFMHSYDALNIFGLFKKILFFLVGLFRPIMRGPATKGEIQCVAIKSAALAAENFVLAIAAQGYASCMMEGFDEVRVRKIVPLNYSQKIVMVIAVGKEGENGTWGPRYRIPFDSVVHKI